MRGQAANNKRSGSTKMRRELPMMAVGGVIAESGLRFATLPKAVSTFIIYLVLSCCILLKKNLLRTEGGWVLCRGERRNHPRSQGSAFSLRLYRKQVAERYPRPCRLCTEHKTRLTKILAQTQYRNGPTHLHMWTQAHPLDLSEVARYIHRDTSINAHRCGAAISTKKLDPSN